jgi:hypothetical protein
MVKITVKEALPPSDGQLMIWTPNPNLVGLQISIDGTHAGTITGYYPSGIGSNPCGSAYCVTTNLSPGSHVVTATIGPYSQNTSINVSSGNCTKFYFN